MTDPAAAPQREWKIGQRGLANLSCLQVSKGICVIERESAVRTFMKKSGSIERIRSLSSHNARTASTPNAGTHYFYPKWNRATVRKLIQKITFKANLQPAFAQLPSLAG